MIFAKREHFVFVRKLFQGCKQYEEMRLNTLEHHVFSRLIFEQDMFWNVHHSPFLYTPKPNLEIHLYIEIQFVRWFLLFKALMEGWLVK